MRKKNRIGFWIFTLGVLMLLLRPYMVYQMTAAHARQGDPVRAWNLLQRLVKKKDDHHELTTDGTAMLVERIQTPMRPVMRRLKLLSSLFIYFPKLSLAVALRHCNFFLPAGRYRYRLTSCLLI